MALYITSWLPPALRAHLEARHATLQRKTPTRRRRCCAVVAAVGRRQAPAGKLRGSCQPLAPCQQQAAQLGRCNVQHLYHVAPHTCTAQVQGGEALEAWREC